MEQQPLFPMPFGILTALSRQNLRLDSRAREERKAALLLSSLPRQTLLGLHFRRPPLQQSSIARSAIECKMQCAVHSYPGCPAFPPALRSSYAVPADHSIPARDRPAPSAFLDRDNQSAVSPGLGRTLTLDSCTY